jgi:hypothetical protein
MSTADEQTDGTSDPPPGDGAPGDGRQSRPPSGPPRHGTPASEDEVSLLDILLVLARHKTLIVRSVADNHWEEGDNESLRLHCPAV